jgi:hypothetical protein
MPERGKRLWRAVFRVSRYHAFVVLAITAALVGFALWYTRDVPLRSSFFDLLPRNDPLIEAYRENEPYLAQTDTVVLLLTLAHPEGKSDAEWEAALLSAAEEVARPLRADPEFRAITYLVEPSPEIPDQYLLLYRLSPEELERIRSSVSLAGSVLAGHQAELPPGADLSETYRAASSLLDQGIADVLSGTAPGGGGEDPLAALVALNQAVLDGIAAIDTLPGITAAVRNLTSIFAPAEPVVREPQALFSRDHTRLLISAQPQLPSSTGVGYCQRIMAAVRRDLAQVDAGALDVTIALTGTYAFATETEEVMTADMNRTELVTAAGVFLVLLLSFRSLLYSLVAGIPLMVSLLLTTVWTKLALGGFNLITTFVPALILGLGDDFSIHLISRYTEERAKGTPFNRALFTAVWRKGIAIFVGSMTIVLVFLGLLSARSRALFEMGVISSVGIFLTFLCAIFLIPALLTAYRFLHRGKGRDRVADHAPRFGGFFRLTSRFSRPILISVFALSGLVAFQASQIRFQFSSADLIPRVPSQETLNTVLTSFDLGGQSTQLGTYFLFFAKTEDELSAVTERLQESPLVLEVNSAQRLLPLNLAEQQKTLGTLRISTYADELALLDRSLTTRQSILSGLPPLLSQTSFIQYAATLNGAVDLAVEAHTLQAQFLEIDRALRTLPVAEARAKVQELEFALRSLDAQLTQVRQLPPVDTLFREVLRSFPPEFSARFITPDGRYIIRARMSSELARGDNLKAFDRFAASFSSDYFGMLLVVKNLERAMKRDFFVSTIIAVALIALIVGRTFRSVPRTLLALAPLGLSYAWMLGGMRFLGINFNFINITISPLLIGIGVDSGVMLLLRYEEEHAIAPTGAIERAGRTTIVAILTSLLTTMLVFATLLAARTPGLRYLGTSALLGLGFSLLFSLLVIPAALSLGPLRRPKADRPAPPEPPRGI